MIEKYIKFSSGQMAYYMEGEGKPIVFLHGWGQSFNSFNRIVEELKNNYSIIGVDFLGFGLSDEPLNPLSLEDYSLHIKTLLKMLNVVDPIIVGHSFGGRVAINYASSCKVDKLILVSSAGIRNRNLSYYYKVYRYKFLKRIYKIFSKRKYENLIKSSGSTDYKNANNVMKSTMSKVLSYPSYKDMKKIDSKTYLLWGINDQTTKYSDCILMNKLIKNSKIIQFYESGHFCYIDEEVKFIRTLKSIIEE